MEQAIRDYTLGLAKAFAKARGIALTTVSRKFHGTVYFFEEWEKGNKTITLKKLDEMLNALKAEWPKGTPWPNPPISTRTPRRKTNN